MKSKKSVTPKDTNSNKKKVTSDSDNEGLPEGKQLENDALTEEHLVDQEDNELNCGKDESLDTETKSKDNESESREEELNMSEKNELKPEEKVVSFTCLFLLSLEIERLSGPPDKIRVEIFIDKYQ